jgi:dTDP-4-amino-4,6-dideoxygalactose transaminase
MAKLAILGGTQAVKSDLKDMFTWPIITKDIEDAVLEVLRAGKMSGRDVTKEFETEYASWLGMKYALGHSSGTAALHGAMFGLGVGRGDEIICPSMTYWASGLPVFSLGGTIVFADIDPDNLCIDPNDIENRISERTKAIVVVHYAGYPADMDPIMEIARKHNIKVIEDCSHSHGSLYKGKMTGTIGDVSAFSLMTGKSFPVGEGGIMCTNDQEVYERALLFGHYARHKEDLLRDGLKNMTGLPWGGYKYRMHQLSSAMGRVQLKQYPVLMKEIDKAMNYFWDLLDGVPGIRANRTQKNSGNTMGGWYAPKGHYVTEELDNLPIARFCEAVKAEGVRACSPGCNKALHLHPLLNDIDVYNDGKPTRIANSERDVRQPMGTLPVAEGIQEMVFSIPWLRRYYPDIIEEHAAAFRKVAENYKDIPLTT